MINNNNYYKLNNIKINTVKICDTNISGLIKNIWYKYKYLYFISILIKKKLTLIVTVITFIPYTYLSGAIYFGTVFRAVLHTRSAFNVTPNFS